MLHISEKYITDESGNRTAVVIDINDYMKIKKIIEQYEGVDALDVNYDIAKALKEVEQGKVKSAEEILGDL